jgi:uncharacterized protein YbjT (DUF2867 family)
MIELALGDTRIMEVAEPAAVGAGVAFLLHPPWKASVAARIANQIGVIALERR